jgi:hypothetical protein
MSKMKISTCNTLHMWDYCEIQHITQILEEGNYSRVVGTRVPTSQGEKENEKQQKVEHMVSKCRERKWGKR